MEKEIIATPTPLGTPPVLSQGVKITGGSLVFISGQVARNAQGEVVGKGDIVAQTRHVIESLNAVLKDAGATLEDVIKVNVYLTDISTHALVTQTRREYFKRDFPTSTLVEVKSLANPDFLIEIEAVAAIQ